MQPATVRDLRGCWRFSVDDLVVERVIVPDPLRLAVGIEGGPLLERRLAEAIRHQGGKGNHLRTVLCQLELEAQIGELTDQDRTEGLPMEDSFAVTSREESVPVVIHASIRIAKPHATPARSSKGDQCLQSQRSQAFASTMHVVDAPGINALTSMRNLRLLLKCRLPLSRAALRGGLTVLLHCLRIFERGVPRPSGSLGNDLWL